jgi:hypothetical protein
MPVAVCPILNDGRRLGKRVFQAGPKAIPIGQSIKFIVYHDDIYPGGSVFPRSGGEWDRSLSTYPGPPRPRG